MKYIKLWQEKPGIDYPIIEPAKVQREFLDNTYNKIGYSCTPLTLANQHGWWFRLPHDVVVEWDGLRSGIDGESGGHVKILEGEFYEGVKVATNESGVGQISFMFNCSIETDPDHYLIFSGPPNLFHEDAKPLEAVWRSDFYNYHSISFNWIITTPNKIVKFPKGMPVLFIKNYPKTLLNETDVLIGQLSENTQLKADSREYALMRNEWFKDKSPYEFRYWYRKEIGPGYKPMTDNPLRLNLKEPRLEE